jgi:NADPH2:quinone reductase
MRAINVTQTGEAEVLRLGDAPAPKVTPGSLLVEVRASGVNFIDVNFRRGTYPLALPYIPGGEGVGVIRALGEGVDGFKVGDRVAWSGGMGSYAELANVPAMTTAILPDTLDDDAGFVIAQGLTAHYLVHDICPLKEGSTALVYAAAGGVGSLLTQILKIRGVKVIAVVSSAAKADSARQAGADEVIEGSGDDFVATVRGLTGGRGVDIVFDSVGAPTFENSLASLRKRGTFVHYGASGGAIESVSPRALAQAGSIAFIRPGLPDYIPDRAAFDARMTALFTWIEEGRLKVDIGGRFPLEQAAEAHRALESRASTGKLILVVRESA